MKTGYIEREESINNDFGEIVGANDPAEQEAFRDAILADNRRYGSQSPMSNILRVRSCHERHSEEDLWDREIGQMISITVEIAAGEKGKWGGNVERCPCQELQQGDGNLIRVMVYESALEESPRDLGCEQTQSN